MNPRFRRRLFIFGPIVLILAFLLWPLGSRKWDIPVDSDAQRVKRDILGRQLQVRRNAARVVLILADDLSIVDPSIYGGRVVQTPNIDSIGEEGVVFTDASCPTAICAPSRASLLTGRYQQRYGFELQPHDQYAWNRLQYSAFRYIIDTDPMVPISPSPVPRRSALSDQGIPAGEIMLSELLSSRGYRTAAFGKWHLGYDEKFSPLRRGFDEHFGFYEAFTTYAPTDDPTIVNTPVDDFSDRHMWNRGREGSSAIVHNDVVVDEDEYLTFRFAELGADYIRENADEPFFLYLPFNAPHTPLQAPKEYHDRFSHVADPARRTYSAMIAALDDAVGAVLGAIEETGIADSTLVIFASDNGGVTYLGVTDNGPYAGGKFTTFQGGLAVPMMMRYPSEIPPGTVYDKPVSLMDIFPTVEAVTRRSESASHSDSESAVPGATAVGRDPWSEVERPLDGVNLFPFVRGEKTGDPHRALYWRSIYNSAVRVGRWKLLVQEAGSPGTDESQLLRLYDLDQDPYEKADLADEHPDVVRELLMLLNRWQAGLQEPLWPPVMHFHIDVWDQRYWFAI